MKSSRGFIPTVAGFPDDGSGRKSNSGHWARDFLGVACMITIVSGEVSKAEGAVVVTGHYPVIPIPVIGGDGAMALRICLVFWVSIDELMISAYGGIPSVSYSKQQVQTVQ